MKKTITTLIALIAITNFKSQNNMGEYTFNLISNLKSPQTSDFVKYGNIPINKFVGEPNLDIPLINIKANQLGDDLAVSLGYNFTGFIPSKRPDIVGLNWFLNVGGVITRQVNSIPDDQKGDSNSGSANGMPAGMYKNGFFVGLRAKSNCLPYHNNAGIFSLTNSNIGFFSADLDYRLRGCDISTAYDGDPDIFSFNFGGYSGKFFLGNDNQIKIIGENSKGFKIDITNVATQPTIYYCRPLDSEIKITDDRGNEYYFGGESRNLEYNIPLSHNNSATVNENEVPSGPPVISAWYLRQIKYANGEIVNFNYKNDDILTNSFCKGSVATTIDWRGNNATVQERKKFIVYNKVYNQDLTCLSNPGSGGDLSFSSCAGTNYSYSVTKKAILENITTSDYKVQFDYSLQPYIFNYEPLNELSFFQQIKNIQLDKIKLYKVNLPLASDVLIKEFSLGYDLKGGTVNQNSYPRLFLKTVQETGKNAYIFNYNLDNGNLPKATTKQIDHWSYYNGNASNESMNYPIPGQSTDSNGDYYYTSGVREPDFNSSLKGILTEVTYPTKGSTVFQYEAPTYEKRLERKKANGYLPSLISYSGTAGGVRIKKILDYTDGSLARERQFQYSEGVLLQWPRYLMQLNNGFQSNVWLTSSSINMNVLESSIINYGTVTETGNGSTISKFSNYITNPDKNDFNVFINSGNPLSSSTDLELAKNKIGMYYNDVSMERGKLIQESVYDNTGQILRKEINVYNDNPQRFDEYVTVVHTSGPAVQANKRYFYQNNLSKKETYEYLLVNGQPKEVLTKENYFYSGAPDYQLIKSQAFFPTGSVKESNIKYAVQKGHSLMVSKNMIGIPLEKEQTQTIGSITKPLSRIEKIYPPSVPATQTGNLVLPTSVISYDLQNNSSTEITYDKYDDKGNLQHYTTRDGISTTVIWGYNKTQPIAKIEGAKLSDISQSTIDAIVNASNTDASAAPNNDESALFTAFKTFRDNLPNYQITTYTYDPLIGVRSITPPSGIRENYLYDSFGRLEKVIDMDGKILKEMKYNYKN